MQKERQTTFDNAEDEEPASDSTTSDDAERRYYYDDAHGYEDYDPEEAEENDEN